MVTSLKSNVNQKREEKIRKRIQAWISHDYTCASFSSETFWSVRSR